MTIPDGLYAAILAGPDDMGLRLAYADAIEAADPQHADLIRTQIEHVRRRSAELMARFPGPGPAVRRDSDEVGSRARGLAQTLHDRLGPPVADLVDPISGQSPVDVYVPEFGARMNERYGPFAWMDEVWAWAGMPGFCVT